MFLFNDALNTFYFTVIWHQAYGKGPQKYEKGRKEMFYLTTHSTHFIYGYNGVGHMVKDHSDSERERKEGNVLFNDAVNTFYFTVMWCQTYGKGPIR